MEPTYTQNQMYTRAQLTCTCARVDPLYDMRAGCSKLLKTIRFESDNGRFQQDVTEMLTLDCIDPFD